MRHAIERTRKLTRIELQRADIVSDVIRYGGGFQDRPGCYACASHLTAKTPDGRRSCPWHWPVVQMVLV